MFNPNPLSNLVFLFGVFSAFFCLYAWSYRTTRGSRMFAFCMASLTIYVLGYSMELSCTNLSAMLFWSRIEYIGISTFPTLFLLFVLQYTGYDSFITPRNVIILFTIPALILIAKWTDSVNHLFYERTWLDNTGIIPLLGFTRGPLYPLASYSIIPVSLGIFLLLRKRRSLLLIYRKQSTILAISALMPLLVFILYLANIEIVPALRYFDWNAFMFPLWGSGVALAVFRYDLLNIAPAAREVLIEHMSDPVFVLDSQTRLVDANTVAQKNMGWDKTPIGLSGFDVFKNWEDQWNLTSTHELTGRSRVEIHDTTGKEEKFYDTNITPILNKNRVIGQLIVMHDITGQKKLQKELLDLSLEDELTRLYNRRGFFVLATQFMQMVKRMNFHAAVVYIDMDTMKMINDTYGHAEGDHALTLTATILRSSIRASDILARFGGDEFVALVLETLDLGAETMLARVEEHFNLINERKEYPYPITISYGIAHYDPAAPKSLEELMEIADRAMYEHKQSKKQSGAT